MNRLWGRGSVICFAVWLLAACVPGEPRATVPLAATVPATSTSSLMFLPFIHNPSPPITVTASPVVVQSGTSIAAAPFHISPSAAPVCPSWQDLDGAFVADIELADDTRMPPLTSFRKTWRIRNSGACAWPEGMRLTYVAGEVLPGPRSVPLPYTAPGGEVDVSIRFAAPAKPGAYGSYWRLQEPDGRLVGAVVFLRIVVDPGAVYVVETVDSPGVSPVTATPSLTVMPSPAVTPSATSSVPVPSTQTSQPTRTLAPTSTPTAIPTLASGNLCRPPDSRYDGVVELAKDLNLTVPCASSGVREETGLLQFYWPGVVISESNPSTADSGNRSAVILAQQSGEIYVLGSRGPNSPLTHVSVHPNSWSPVLPARSPTCEILVPPGEAVFPVEGIGMVWCAESLWLTIGWPISPPLVADLLLQPTWGGMLMEVRAGGAVHLIAVDHEQGRAVIYDVP